MELWEAFRHRKMVRSFDQRAIPADVLDHVLASVRHAPSAGFTQGNEYLVLDQPDAVATFWRLTDDPLDPLADVDRGQLAPALVLPLANRDAYVARYSLPDKIAFGMDQAENWPSPFWDIDAAMATMCMLLAAVDAGLGGFFFGISHGEGELLEHFRVPTGFRPIGAVGLGYPAAVDPLAARSSARSRRRRPVDELVHRNGW
jgi:nitroreductase